MRFLMAIFSLLLSAQVWANFPQVEIKTSQVREDVLQLKTLLYHSLTMLGFALLIFFFIVLVPKIVILLLQRRN